MHGPRALEQQLNGIPKMPGCLYGALPVAQSGCSRPSNLNTYTWRQQPERAESLTLRCGSLESG